ncbi:uncharacterized protein K489DRAFT_376495 [Dissoconium aciculare CBS 342.82]|uniref:Uncharacterized protein n=1 Tax=Dissoconium aciculare CBS 342.82 TaxID=1314786 RepID=A0A6J3MDK8_9PEZI|nr:uncharacterized protein K489DRAFT_376495 [Dissoconium aciculare CBS 342.82]KAF1826100.1 hypothetical protein K489DRAFT_376495 [Dissoconium aciculare CBS 342.82]
MFSLVKAPDRRRYTVNDVFVHTDNNAMDQSDLLQSSTTMVRMQHSRECLFVWVVADLVFNGFGKFLNAPKAPVRSPVAGKAWTRAQVGGGRVCMQRVLSPKLFRCSNSRSAGGEDGATMSVQVRPSTNSEFLCACADSLSWILLSKGGTPMHAMPWCCL